MEESRHEAAEEQYFWPAVEAKAEGGPDLAARAIEQETEGKKLLATLDGMSPDNVEFESVLREFITAAREHIEFEQQQVWPRLSAALSVQESEELAKKVERAKAIGPTRPHPDTPPNPAVLKTAGVAAAAMDRARDAMTNRGEKD
jgi:hemerythrin-like domain-containing protein